MIKLSRIGFSTLTCTLTVALFLAGCLGSKNSTESNIASDDPMLLAYKEIKHIRENILEKTSANIVYEITPTGKNTLELKGQIVSKLEHKNRFNRIKVDADYDVDNLTYSIDLNKYSESGSITQKEADELISIMKNYIKVRCNGKLVPKFVKHELLHEYTKIKGFKTKLNSDGSFIQKPIKKYVDIDIELMPKDLVRSIFIKPLLK